MIATLEFDLSTALLRSILQSFDDLDWSPLTAGTLTTLGVTDGQGVYQLGYINSAGLIDLVYIGKTDVKAGLNTRLTRHSLKIQHRVGMVPGDVFFKAIRVYVFTPMDLEQQLIDHYKIGGISPPWNTSGFGSNDPGRERDTSNVKSTHFDAVFPIDTSLAVTLPFALGTPVPIYEVLQFLKSAVSYVIRFEMKSARSRTAHPDLLSATVSFSTPVLSVENVLKALKPSLTAPSLGDPWQITVFPGYVILYKEHRSYAHGKIL